MFQCSSCLYTKILPQYNASHKFSSPNNGTISIEWPEYTSPDWSYLELASGSEGLKTKNEISNNCKFWNEKIPQLVLAAQAQAAQAQAKSQSKK